MVVFIDGSFYVSYGIRAVYQRERVVLFSLRRVSPMVWHNTLMLERNETQLGR